MNGEDQLDLIADLLKDINTTLKSVESILERLVAAQGLNLRPTDNLYADMPLDVVTLLSLPDHLRKTAIVLSKKGEATANEIATETRKARAVESSYLNQLCTMNFVNKRREGRTVYFYVKQ
jgi:hypothetical protein